MIKQCGPDDQINLNSPDHQVSFKVSHIVWKALTLICDTQSDDFWVGRFKYKLLSHTSGTIDNQQEFYKLRVLTPAQYDVVFGKVTSLQMQVLTACKHSHN